MRVYISRSMPKNMSVNEYFALFNMLIKSFDHKHFIFEQVIKRMWAKTWACTAVAVIILVTKSHSNGAAMVGLMKSNTWQTQMWNPTIHVYCRGETAHFTQVAVDGNNKVGCLFLKFESQPRYFTNWACDFGRGTFVYFPVYDQLQPGQTPGQGCTKGTDSKYTSLCNWIFYLTNCLLLSLTETACINSLLPILSINLD